MKHTALFFFVVVYCLFSISLSSAVQKPARPDLVHEVMEGKRQEARASWWGFDAEDSTEYLQQAINSRVKKLIIDRKPTPWVTRPLTGVSNQEIVLESGAQLAALKGAFYPKGDCLLSFRECENVVIRGEKEDGGKSAQMRMHKEDYQSSAYEKSEWRHGLLLSGCRNVLIQDLTIERTGGDGIYLGASPTKGANLNVVIRRVDCNDNHRQGISVISADGLLIEDCRLRNTNGTAPQAGIDFEPNSTTDSLVHCVLRRCVAEGNAGTGYQLCPQSMSSKSIPVSIVLEDCISRGNGWHAIHLCSAQNDQPRGTLVITGFLSENDNLAGLSVQFNPFNGIGIEMRDSVVRDASRKDPSFPPIYVQGVGSDTRPTGNIRLNSVTIKDDLDRPFIKVRDPKGNGIQGIRGRITLERNGLTQTIVVDDNWLRRYSRGGTK